jgi:hypothetical protein
VKKNELIVLSQALRMAGELKVGGDLRVENDFCGKINAKGLTHFPSGITVKADVVAGGLRLETGALLRGRLQIGEARKPLQRMRNWWHRFSRVRE